MEMERMLDGLEMGMCFDIGHANTTGQIGAMLALEARFVNMHVHDNDGTGDQHLGLGYGNIDFSVLRLLKYRGNHILEAATPDIEAALASRRTLQDVVE